MGFTLTYSVALCLIITLSTPVHCKINDSDVINMALKLSSIWKINLLNIIIDKESELAFLCNLMMVNISTAVSFTTCISLDVKRDVNLVIPSNNGFEYENTSLLLYPHIWIVPSFISPKTSLKLNSEFYQYYECDEGICIREIYTIKGGEEIIEPVAKYDIKKQSIQHFNEVDVLERRSNLRGTVLVNAILPTSSFHLVDKDLSVEGPFADIMDAMMLSLNCSLEHKFPENNQWGSLQDDGISWNGVVGMLVNGEADVAFSPLSQTLPRKKVIDFSMPFFRSMLTLITAASRRKGSKANFYSFINIFSPMLWLFIALITIGLAIAIRMAAKFCRVRKHQTLTFVDSVTMVCLALIQRDYAFRTDLISLKIIWIITCVFGYLMFSAYTADLTSSMIAIPPENEINSFEDLLKTNDHQLYTYGGGYLADYFSSAKPDTVVNQVYKKYIEGKSEAYFYGTKFSIEILMSNPERAVIFDEIFAYSMYSNQVKFSKTFRERQYINVGMGLQKNSELTNLFNHHILRLHQTGVIQRIFRKWSLVPDVSISTNSGLYIQAESIGMQQLMLAATILCLGTSLAILLSCIELFVVNHPQ